MATAVSWLICTVVLFLGFGVVGCSALGARRRPRFYLRLGCASLLMLALAVALAFAINFSALPQPAFGPAWLALLLAALAVAPTLCFHGFASSQGPSDTDSGGGGGPGPPRPPPNPPPGGAPLADADPARARRRDHNRPNLRGARQRRPTTEPAQPRTPTPSRR